MKDMVFAEGVVMHTHFYCVKCEGKEIIIDSFSLSSGKSLLC